MNITVHAYIAVTDLERGIEFYCQAVYDGAMESSFRHPPHQQLLKGQTMISETLKHRR